MKLHMLSVFDGKVNAFGQPMFTTSIGSTERTFIDEVNRSDVSNVMFNHPEDFLLYHIGTFDDATGTVENIIPPIQIASGVNVKR